MAASLIGGITLHAFSGVSANAAEDDTGEKETAYENKLKAICTRIYENKDKLNNWKRCQVSLGTQSEHWLFFLSLTNSALFFSIWSLMKYQ